MSSVFRGGPADGEQLTLRRAVLLLRVVRGPKGWDALDQQDDEVRKGERVHVYRLAGEPGWMHVSCRPRSQSFSCVRAEYEYLDPQPPFEVLYDRAKWVAWCGSNWRSVAPEWFLAKKAAGG